MNLPDEIPVMILPTATLFPGTMLPLYIFEARYRRMLNDVLESHRMFCVAMQRQDWVRESPCRIAGLGLVRASVTHPNGTSNLILQGISRVQLHKSIQYKPYRKHAIQVVNCSPSEMTATHREMCQTICGQVERLLDTGFHLPSMVLKKNAGTNLPNQGEPLIQFDKSHILKHLAALNNAEHLADLVSSTLLTHPGSRQSILESLDLSHRLTILIQYLDEEIQRRLNHWNE